VALYGALAATGIAAVGLIAVGVSASGDKKKKGTSSGKRGAPDPRKPAPKGRIFCPYEENKTPANPNLVAVNDFVIIKLVSADRHYAEDVWGHVLSISPDKDKFQIELAAPLVAAGFKPIHTEKHGFYLGEKLKVHSDCVYDVLHKGDPERYELLCGVLLDEHGYKGLPKEILKLKKGDMVTLVVGNAGITAEAIPGKTWNEEIRVWITSLGKTGTVLHGLVWEDPDMTDQHGLRKYSKLDFTRDCIVKV